MPTISQTEEDILNDIDRLIEFHRKNGSELKKITVSKKQYNALKRLEKKAEKGPLIRRAGEVSVNRFGYNGIKFEVAQSRRSYSKKDTGDMF